MTYACPIHPHATASKSQQPSPNPPQANPHPSDASLTSALMLWRKLTFFGSVLFFFGSLQHYPYITQRAAGEMGRFGGGAPHGQTLPAGGCLYLLSGCLYLLSVCGFPEVRSRICMTCWFQLYTQVSAFPLRTASKRNV